MASKSQLKTINEILKIEEMTVTAYQLITGIGCVIYLKNQQSSMACSNCGHLSNKLHQNHWLTVRDLPLGENPVYLKINRRQFKCLNCDRKFSEEFRFVKKRSSFTNRVKQKIVEEILSSDIKNVAKRNGLSEQEIETILKEIGADLTKKKPENLKRLGIDEIALVKGQKNYKHVILAFQYLTLHSRFGRTVKSNNASSNDSVRSSSIVSGASMVRICTRDRISRSILPYFRQHFNGITKMLFKC
jgi:transposase